MAGKRLEWVSIVEKPVHLLLAGEATYDERGQAWYIGCPSLDDSNGINNLGGHTVRYDEQAKLLTVMPSILCGCGAHYYIEANRIRWV